MRESVTVLTALVLLGLLLGPAAPIFAEEGMWLPSQLAAQQAHLQELGLTIKPEQLQDLDSLPLHAVVSLGGCTASFVSPQGLVVTNHHCALRAIQHSSTAERNLIEEGFLAATMAEELPAGPGSRVWVTFQIDDVTDRLEAATAGATSGKERFEAQQMAEKELVADCEATPGQRCDVHPTFGGMQYLLVKQREILDLRLVYAPAAGIGNFGGDVDNWMWPRHTGDFAFFRAYVGADGEPAEPAEGNRPFHPKHWLRPARQGLSEGDLVLVAGYPGRTNRYRIADEVAFTFEWFYPTRRQAMEEQLSIIEQQTRDRPAAQLKYASLVSGINNTTKSYLGMLSAYPKSGLLQHKQALEQRLQRWIDGDDNRRQRWGTVLSELRGLVAEQSAQRRRDLSWSLMKRTAMLSTARLVSRLSRERLRPDLEREPGFQQRDEQLIEARLARLDRVFDPVVEQAALHCMLLRYAEQPAADRMPALDRWLHLDQGPLDPDQLAARLAQMYTTTGLDKLETRLGLLDASVEQIEASDDPFLRLAVSLLPGELEREAAEKELDGRLHLARARFMKALVTFLESQGRQVYPDANSTLRVTYGTVEGYQPRDGVRYLPFTTGNGILEKAAAEAPFKVPPPLLAALQANDFGPYGVGEPAWLPVNFLSSVDTTGGNSGSPTINGKGELVGLLFDGNWESLIADWDFVPDLTRSIHVDLRYLLWVMDRVDHAWVLLQEMGVEPHFEARPPGSASG